MNTVATSQTPEAFLPARRAERVAGALGGLACAGLIFGALALSRTPETVAPPDEVFVARQAVLPVELPPPPPQARPASDLMPMGNPIQLEVAASTSAVRLVVPDIPILTAEREMPMARPEVSARFDLARSAVRPQLDVGEVEGRRVFERYEVDQPPLVLDRVRPRVLSALLEEGTRLRTVMLLIVNVDGSVGEVRLLQTSRSEPIDAIMMETVRQWRFSPAVRKNRKVRCWVQQAITVQLGSGTPFGLN